MNLSELIAYFRMNLSIEETSTTALLALTDQQLALYFKIVGTRDFPEITSWEFIPNESIFSLVLLTKIEIYYFLATTKSEQYDIRSDDGISLKKDQRYQHYYQLIRELESKYNQYIIDGGAGGNTVKSFNAILPDRSYTSRNYELSSVPRITIFNKSIGDSYFEVYWSINCDNFRNTSIYLSTSKLYDPYGKDPIIDRDCFLKEYSSLSQNKLRVTGLLPDTDYYLLIVVSDITGKKGYSEKKITILGEGEVDIIEF